MNNQFINSQSEIDNMICGDVDFELEGFLKWNSLHIDPLEIDSYLDKMYRKFYLADAMCNASWIHDIRLNIAWEQLQTVEPYVERLKNDPDCDSYDRLDFWYDGGYDE